MYFKGLSAHIVEVGRPHLRQIPVLEYKHATSVSRVCKFSSIIEQTFSTNFWRPCVMPPQHTTSKTKQQRRLSRNKIIFLYLIYLYIYLYGCMYLSIYLPIWRRSSLSSALSKTRLRLYTKFKITTHEITLQQNSLNVLYDCRKGHRR